jgi:curved DNA-binding protein CbpA
LDRFDNAKADQRIDEKLLQKALGVITQSYQGVPPEKLYFEAIHCFDALIDISLNTENIRSFAQKKSLDLKYLVDGANFVISKMQFNPEKNHYITLGLSRTASGDTIRERWKRLMLLYHPDRQEGSEEWVSERAKKVNEAYNTLKDEVKRHTYDRQLQEPSLDIQHPPHPNVRRTKISRYQSTIFEMSPGWIKARKYLPKLLVGAYVVAALIFIWVIYVQNRSSHLETALLNEKAQSAERTKEVGSMQYGVRSEEKVNTEIQTETGTGKGKGTDTETGKDIKAERIQPTLSSSGGQEAQSAESTKEEAKAGIGILRQAQDKKQSDGILRQKSGSAESSVPLAVSPEPSAAKSPEETSQARKEVLKAVESPLVGSTAMKPARSLAKDEIQTTSQTASVPAEKKINDVRKAVSGLQSGQYARPPAAETITRQEVEAFMNKYVEAYKKSDITTFMSLFSESAIENDTITYAAIRRQYQRTFKDRIRSYAIKNMDINIVAPDAYVSGEYVINRFMSKENNWKRLTGTIRWKITREGSSLKITRINYDY